MKYFSRKAFNKNEINSAREDFEKFNVVDITSFFDDKFRDDLTVDTISTYRNKQSRKDFLMKQTENTPRNMFSVSEKNIEEESKIIPSFYASNEVSEFISKITSSKPMRLPWKGERYVINGLSEKKDTHGWHWDDYSFALVFIAKAPNREHGGSVECIRDTTWNRSKPDIKNILVTHKPKSYYYESGSFYLMKSDTTLHRVAPITSKTSRVAIAMSWCTKEDLLKDIDHETVYELYDEVGQ